ncbi:Hemolysin A [Poriferisphaera corsica]|uniref:Hemolysin A n=1 Tax=Poriferisphaera corsica TaxID=2528020 RepID=A0A517YYT7_9BACT|nr:SAM-dependent methyltransferase [Poriferisphaera corsica]QDU35369.1 Hemolysin A [Poriferisphaera corsica]
MDEQKDFEFVSRGGLKLWEAIGAFKLNAEGKVCCDLGCSVGGFVEAWLRAGAKKVYAVDTAYGQLAWKLRQDERVIVLERKNALHVEVGEPCDFVSVDLGWTKQDRAVPAALRWLKNDDQEARVVSLIKPHYEMTFEERGLDDSTENTKYRGKKGKKKAKAKRLTDDEAAQVNDRVLKEIMPGLEVKVEACIESPIRGAKGGNVEYLAELKRLHRSS